MLRDFLIKHKESIIKKWIKMLQVDIGGKYFNRPFDELHKTVTLAFNGNFEVLCSNNWDEINKFIIFITKIRLEKGFTLSEVQRAFAIFRIILIEILPKEFDGDALISALKSVNHSVDVTINKFSDYFQEKHEEMITNMLKILEEKVKERTNELAISEFRYRTLVEDINDGYFVSKNKRIIFANNALCRMFGYTKSEIINMSYEELINMRNIGESIKALGIKKNNSYFPVEIKATNIIFENDNAVAGICRDITEREKIEENERLAMIGRLATAFAHELRNSLSSIKVNIQILKSKLTLDPIDEKRIEIVFRDIRKLDKILNDTFSFTKPLYLNQKITNINNIVSYVIKKEIFLIESYKITLKLVLSSNIRDNNIDEEKLEFVIVNLLYNAVDALKDKKGERIIVVTTRQLKIRGEQQIDIYDNGCGIDKTLFKDIFKPFFTTKSKGMGLGLSNVLKVVNLHKGRIEVKSEKGKFTKFTVFLPC